MWWWILATACVEPLADPTPYVTSPRVLAVIAEPPEVAPGATSTLRAVTADADGPGVDPGLRWTRCDAPRPLAELGPVAPACLDPDDERQVPLGEGLTVDAPLPADVCARFGPNPPVLADGAAGRPVDPDVTGGFHQPVLAFPDAGLPVLASVRARCGIANVTQETFITWNLRYRDNRNPVVSTLTADGEPLSTDPTSPTPLPAGAEVRVAVAWPDCPASTTCGDGVCGADEDRTTCLDDCATPTPCDGAEPYVRFDPATAALTTTREAVSATWFVPGGVLADARTGVAGDDPTTGTGTTWTVPEAPGLAWLTVVLRDERGGVGAATGWAEVGAP